MTKPVRVQLRRTKGWQMPPNTVKVSRPTKWGNPFKVGDPSPKTGQSMTADECVSWYRRGLVAAARAWDDGPFGYLHECQKEVYDAWEARTPHLFCVELQMGLRSIRGKNLACFCGLDQPCHADVLLDLANSPRWVEAA